MRNLIIIILVSLLIPYQSTAQENVELNLVFGNYQNDHKKKVFYFSERSWSLNKGELIYTKEANQQIYADTVTISKEEIKTIASFITEHELKKSISKDLSVAYLNKRDSKIIIKGNIKYNHRNANYQIKANSSTIMSEDPTAQKLKNLEELLQKFLEDE